MKRIFFLIVALTMFLSCEKNQEEDLIEWKTYYGSIQINDDTDQNFLENFYTEGYDQLNGNLNVESNFQLLSYLTKIRDVRGNVSFINIVAEPYYPRTFFPQLMFLDSLTSIGGDLLIEEIGGISSLYLKNLTLVEGNISSSGLNYFDSLNFPSLKYIGKDLSFQKEVSFEESFNIGTLLIPELDSVGNDVFFNMGNMGGGYGGPVPMYGDFSKLKSIGGLFTFHYNGPIKFNFPSITSLKNMCFKSNLDRLRSDIYIDTNEYNGPEIFPSLTEVKNELEISGFNTESLFFISSLRNVRSLSIKYNPSLKSLSGLENIQDVGYLYIMHNDSLINFCSIASEVYLSSNTSINITGNRFNPSPEELMSGICKEE